MKVFKYGIIGTGMIAQEHINNIALLENCRVTAIMDTLQSSLDTTLTTIKKHWDDMPNCYLDLKDMLANEELDMIVLCSPNFTHFEILKYVFENHPKIAVLAEKPICTRKEDCQSLIDLEKNHQAPVWVGMEYRFIPAVSRLINDLKEQKAGNLKMLTIKEHRFPFLKKIGDWNRFSANTGGTLTEKCCHFFDLMRHIIQDEPVRIYASGSIDVNHLDEIYDGKTPDIIDNAYVIVEFKGGQRALLELSMFAEGSYFQEEISAVGDAAKLEAKIPGVQRFWPGALENPETAPKPLYITSPRATKAPVTEIIEAGQNVLNAGDHHGSMFYQHLAFLDAVQGKGSVEVTMLDGVRAVMMGLAAEESAKTNTLVELNF